MSTDDRDSWAQDLQRHGEAAIPVIPVDVGEALRQGRRARTVRRAGIAGGATAVLAAAAVFVVLVAPFPSGAGLKSADSNGDSSPASPLTVASAAGPDCFAEDVLREIGLLDGTGPDRQWRHALLAAHPPSASRTRGPIPADFAATHAVVCRFSERLSADDPPRYEAVTLTGDIGALTHALALGDIVVEGPQPCNDIGYAKLQLFLVDEDGLAVRPVLPIDRCGDIRPEVKDAIAALGESDVQVYSVN